MKSVSCIRPGLVLLLLAALVAGCSQLPTAPTVGPSASGVTTVAPHLDEPDSPATTVEAPAVLSAESSRSLTPLLGGTVRAGQFRVIVPPGALRMPAVVKLRQADLSKREVQLEITPASANGFLVPVLLVADCSDMSARLLSVQTIYWWNPTAARWEAVVGAQVNLLGKSVSVPLWHFSTYKVDGKAGW